MANAEVTREVDPKITKAIEVLRQSITERRNKLSAERDRLKAEFKEVQAATYKAQEEFKRLCDARSEVDGQITKIEIQISDLVDKESSLDSFCEEGDES